MEKRYYPTYKYNTAIVLDLLHDMVEDNGGEVVTQWYDHTYCIKNRSLDERMDYLRERIAALKSAPRESQFPKSKPSKYARQKAIAEYKRELDELSRVDNEFRENRHQSYIRFNLDGDEYYVQVDENPFFGFMVAKNNDCHTYEPGTPKMEWAIDDLFSLRCDEESREYAARELFDIVTNVDRIRIPGCICSDVLNRLDEIFDDQNQFIDYYKFSYDKIDLDAAFEKIFQTEAEIADEDLNGVALWEMILVHRVSMRDPFENRTTILTQNKLQKAIWTEYKSSGPIDSWNDDNYIHVVEYMLHGKLYEEEN